MNADDDERTADMANPAAKYTDEFRRETADYIISTGRPTAECCRELGLNPKTVDKWVARRRREARKRIRELEMENAFLKKAAAFFAREQG